MQTIEKVFGWLLNSSSDPEKVSLTVRGFLVGLIPLTMTIVGLTHVNLGQDALTTIINSIASFVQAILTAIASLMVVIGAVRKVWNTLFPKPPVAPQA